jgi:hypothetical protein
MADKSHKSRPNLLEDRIRSIRSSVFRNQGATMVSSDDDNDKLKKQPRRLQRNRSEASNDTCVLELGAFLSLLVFLLHFFAFWLSVNSLPDVPASPDWKAHMGENFNLPLNSFNTYSEGKQLLRRTLGIPGDDKKKFITMVQVPFKKGEDKEVQVPKSKWPVSLRNEVNDYQTIVHPGDRKTDMTVPKFWSLPIHNNKLMSRETAMKIGTCTEPDPETGSFQRGDKCPTIQRTLFIGIASFRDFECRTTVESAFDRAKHPERIRIGVVDQVVNGVDVACNEPIKPCKDDPNQALCKYKDQVDVFTMDAGLSVGPVFARHLGYRMYRGEYYASQLDAHVTFIQDWDVQIIDQWESARNEMAVLSTYLTDIQGAIDENGHSKIHTRPIMCNTVWEGNSPKHLRHAAQPEKLPSIHGQPQLSPWWAAGYSFSRGHFIVNVPYDLYQVCF